MKMSKFYLVLFLIFFITLGAYPATYYIDSESGSDSKPGTSETQAWKTISKVNSKTFQPGDVILFKSGGKWREQLNVKSSGSAGSPITIGSYGNSSKPVISGADALTGFTRHSGNVWKISSASPRQVFFNNIRGKNKTSISDLTEERDWYFNSGLLYVRSASDPSSILVEAAVRLYSVNITGSNIIVKDLHVEKTSNPAVVVSSGSENIVVDNLDVLQWSDEITTLKGGVTVYGKNCVVKNCTFGKDTGNEIADQNWSGYIGIFISGRNIELADNKIYHNSIENEDINGKFAYGIRFYNAGGLTKIHGNTIYHTGGNGVFGDGKTVAGDEIHVYNNTTSYTGQAGIGMYKTRAGDGIGGVGYVYKNNVSFANRLGGELGGGGNRSAGIHFNDGREGGIDPAHPFIKWYCYENVVHSSRSLNERNSPDSDGIALDFNANGVEVYKNLIYNCDGKGMYIWNADNCKVYYNIIYGNDCGISVAATGQDGETADNNEIFNNVFYKNYNGDDRGKNVDAELYFGQNSSHNRFVNNILYASANGFAYKYNTTNTTGCIVDYNLVYSEAGKDAKIGTDTYGGNQTFSKWKSNHDNFDRNSICADPLFRNAENFDFRLKPGSPAIKSGKVMGLLTDFLGFPVTGLPSIGAFELLNLTNKIKIKVFLQGAFNNGSMNTQLSSLNLLPANNPYNNAPWNYSGSETISSVSLNIVDWVLVELRGGLNSSTRVAQKAMLLRSDGSLLDISGSEELDFGDVPGGEYYIVIYHRNHLPVMSSEPVDFTADTPAYDFTTSASKAYGDNSLAQLKDGIYGMLSGDSDANGVIDDSDFTDVGTRIFNNGYDNADLDLNHVINVLDYGKSSCNMNKRSQIPE